MTDVAATASPTNSANGTAASHELTARRLAALAEIGRTIVSGADYEEVLAAVIEKVTRIMGASGGGFMLYDEATGELVTQRPAFGLPDELVDAYRVSLSTGGNAATVFVTGEPYYSNSAQDDPRVIHHFAELHGISKVLTVPLQVEGRSIGVFHAIDKAVGEFTSDDAALLALIAPQLAVIIQSAEVMRRLRKRERQLGRALEVQEELIDMLLSGEGPAALVSRLSQLVGTPVLLTDVSHRSTAGDEQGMAEVGIEADELQRALDDDLDAAESDAEEHFRHVQCSEGTWLTVVPVRTGREILGHLVAVNPHGRSTHEEVRVMQQAAVLFALEIVRERQLFELRRRVDADILDHVFQAQSKGEADALLERLDIRPAVRYRGAVIELTAPDVESALHGGFQTVKTRAQRQFRSRLAESHGGVAVVDRGKAFWLVIPYSSSTIPEDDRERLQRFARRVASEVLVGHDYEFLMGVGDVVEDATELCRSFEQGVQAIEIVRHGGPRNSAVFFDELGVYRLLAQPADTSDLGEFADSVLASVLEYDERRDADWLEFLQTLVIGNFGMTAAAARSNLHINTVKYRVARLQEMLARDFNNPNDRFEVQLALQILEVRRRVGD